MLFFGNGYPARFSWNLDNESWMIEVGNHPDITEPIVKMPLAGEVEWVARQVYPLADNGDEFTLYVPHYIQEGKVYYVQVVADNLWAIGNRMYEIAEDTNDWLVQFNVRSVAGGPYMCLN